MSKMSKMGQTIGTCLLGSVIAFYKPSSVQVLRRLEDPVKVCGTPSGKLNLDWQIRKVIQFSREKKDRNSPR